MSTYLNLCTQVYELSKPIAPQDAYDFYKYYASSSNGAILEPMCGTGRFLLPLAEAGFDVHGFDKSASMLNVLRQKAVNKNRTLDIWEDDILHFKRQGNYGLIFIPSGSFGLLTEPLVIKNALTNLYQHLAPNGKLVFEVETREAVPEPLGVWRGQCYKTTDSSQILASFFSTITEDICTCIGKYELVEHNTVIKTEVEEYNIKLYQDTDTLKALLFDIGFSKIKLIKAYQHEEIPAPTDPVIIYECIK